MAKIRDQKIEQEGGGGIEEEEGGKVEIENLCPVPMKL